MSGRSRAGEGGWTQPFSFEQCMLEQSCKVKLSRLITHLRPQALVGSHSTYIGEQIVEDARSAAVSKDGESPSRLMRDSRKKVLTFAKSLCYS